MGIVGAEKKIKKLKNFIRIYEKSPKMIIQVATARQELAGYERQLAWFKSKLGVLPQSE